MNQHLEWGLEAQENMLQLQARYCTAKLTEYFWKIIQISCTQSSAEIERNDQWKPIRQSGIQSSLPPFFSAFLYFISFLSWHSWASAVVLILLVGKKVAYCHTCHPFLGCNISQWNKYHTKWKNELSGTYFVLIFISYFSTVRKFSRVK